MKVLIVANRFFSISNSRQVLLSKLTSQQHDVVVVAEFDGYEKNIQTNVKQIEASFRYSFSGLWRAYLRLRTILKTERPTVVHAFNPIPIIASAYFTPRFGYKLIISFTGLGAAFSGNPLLRSFVTVSYKWAISRATKAVFQNKDDFDYFANVVSVSDKQKLQLIISSGVDLGRFQESTRRRSATFNIVFIGRLMKQKGVHYLVKIAKELYFYKDVHVHVLGEYDKNHRDTISDEDFTELIELGNVTFHGYIRDIENYYKKFDLFICSSVREGVPRVILEASAVGLPTIAFDVPGVREAISNGVNGYLIPAFNINEFVEAILKLKEDHKLYANISRQARSYIAQSFSQESIADSYLRLYEKIVK